MADEALQGVEAYTVRDDALRKKMAFNALTQAYGPIAGDPQAALQMQQYGQNQKLDPIAVDQARANLTGTSLENTGRQDTNAFNEAANPLKLTGLGLGNEKTTQDISQSAQAFPLEQQQRQATIGQTKAQTGYIGAETAHTNQETANSAYTLTQAKAANDRNAAFGILGALSDTVNEGGDVGSTFDKYAPLIAQYEGVDQAHMPQLRALLTQDPQGTITKLTAALTAQGMLPNAKTGATNSKNPMAQPPAQRAQMVNAMKFIAQRDAAVPDMVTQAQALLPKMSNSAIIRKANLEIPGTPEYQFAQIQHQIAANLSLDDLRTLRATGFTLGRTNIAEFQGSAQAIANMDLGQDPKQLHGNLDRVGSIYRQMNTDMAGDIARLSVGIPGINKGAQQHGQFTEGQVYQDAQGNKAKFQGGKWVPVQ